MEDGIRPVEDGEPDVFLSHSYSENCRRVDMALFECDCPNHKTCCSHAYAALVALPTYRHRAALMWHIRLQMHEDHLGFETLRNRVKASMLQRLPLDDLVDASIDAALGMWTRVEWLRKGLAPKLSRLWGDRVERALAGATCSNDPKRVEATGSAAQKRLQAFLGKLHMNSKELAPLLLSLGEGKCGDEQELSSQLGEQQQERWCRLSRSVWAHIVGDELDKSADTCVSIDEVQVAITAAEAEAAVEVPEWRELRTVERLWRVESLTLRSLGVDSFPELRVPKCASQQLLVNAANTGGTSTTYKSFVELLSDWPEAPASLVENAKREDGTGKGPELLEREAVGLLEEMGRGSLNREDGGRDVLAALLNSHLGRVGEPSDWTAVVDLAFSATAMEDSWRQSSMLSAHAAIWEPDATNVNSSLFSELAKEGWEAAAARLTGNAPPLAELREWLLWDEVFEAHLGSLRTFLRRTSPGLGVAIFEMFGGEFLKLDASAGTTEAWGAALLAVDARLAAESLLAYCHSCGSIRASSLRETLGSAYSRAADALADEFAAFVGEIIAELPRPFRQSPTIAKFLLAPLGEAAALGPFVEMAGTSAAETASLFCSGGGFSGAVALSKRAAGRLAVPSGGEMLGADLRAGSSRRFQRRNVQGVQRKQLPGFVDKSIASPSDGAKRTSVVDETALQATSDSDTRERIQDDATSPLRGVVDQNVPRTTAIGSDSVVADLGEVLVMQIRREDFGFDGDTPIGGDLQIRQNSRLARALRRLAGELYGNDVHWQLELLQNADDNSYGDGDSPTAEFTLRPGEVVFRCNEKGFREADIRAICDIGNSSKVGAAKYAAGGRVLATGEKGLGFKAVFALTNTPHIFSGPYRIEFDALHQSGIGYVLPRWIGGSQAADDAAQLLTGGWGSVIRMPLRPDLLPRRSDIYSRLVELPPSSLLFLKQLRDISVVEAADSKGGTPGGVRMRRADSAIISGSEARWQENTIRACVEVSRDDGETWEAERWLLLRRRVDVPEGVMKPGISVAPTTTLVELALPLNAEGAVDSRGAQPVFAFLPVRTYGFNFALQADWAVSSSREELLGGCEWNEFLKAQLPKLFIELVDEAKRACDESPLKWSFYGLVPPLASAPQFFRSSVVQIHAKLRDYECMLTDEGKYCVPRLTLRCSSEARAVLAVSAPTTSNDASREEMALEGMEASSMIRTAMRSQGMHLVHHRVEATAPAGLLDSLGVQRFGVSHLLRILPIAAESRPCLDTWRRPLVLLDELLDATPRADAARLLQVAQQLSLLPLKGGAWSAANAGVFLPPVGEDAQAFPPALLSELRAVDPKLMGDGNEDALTTARLRKLMRRLGVTPLTPRQVLRDVVGPLFRDQPAPCVLDLKVLTKSGPTYLAFSGFVAAHKEMVDEITEPIGWPLVGMDAVAVGRRFSAPALHSPRAVSFFEALRDSPVKARLPAVPSLSTGSDAGVTTAKFSELLESLGLALPGPLVEASAGDWRSQEFDILVACCLREKESSGIKRARFLAEGLDAAWSRYERYACRDNGSPSTFMNQLRNTPWIPADAAEDALDDREGEPTPKLFKAADLCIGTPAICAVFTDMSLLAGRLTTAVSGRFAEALGLMVQPSVSLAVDVLRGFGRCSAVGPEVAAAVYAYIQREAADLTPLRRSATVVVAAGKPALAPSDVVWEDPSGACSLPELLPLYGERWRAFFVLGLGVPERPRPDQVLRRVDELASSTTSLDALWAVLLFIGEQLEFASSVRKARACGVSTTRVEEVVLAPVTPSASEAAKTELAGCSGSVAIAPQLGTKVSTKLATLEGFCHSASSEASEWVTAAKALWSRRCLPLEGGGVGVPSEGIIFTDDCPRVPPRVIEAARAAASLAAVPPSGTKGSAYWLPLLRAVGLRPLSEACSVCASHDGEKQTNPSLGKSIAALLAVGQRYLFHRHRVVHDAASEQAAARTRALSVRVVERPLRLACRLHSRDVGSPETAACLNVDVDAFLEDANPLVSCEALGNDDAAVAPELLVAANPNLPAVCIELSRLLLPPAAARNEELIIATRHAREALTTFLISASAGDPENLCGALGIGCALPEDTLWPVPDEVCAYVKEAVELCQEGLVIGTGSLEGETKASEKRTEGKKGKEDNDSERAPAEDDGSPAQKKRRVATNDAGGELIEVPDLDGLGGGQAGDGNFGMVTAGSEGGHKDMGGRGKGAEDSATGSISRADLEGSDGHPHDPSGKGKHDDSEGKGGGAIGKGANIENKGSGKGERNSSKGKRSTDLMRDADDVGEVLRGLPRLESREFDVDAVSARKAGKSVKTQVYDIDDLRKVTPKLELAPREDENNLSDEERKAVGLWGEKFVFNYLQRKLESEKAEEDGKHVVWVNEAQETGFQYDIRIDNRFTGEVEAYVEVKATRTKDKHLFEMSYNEWTFAQKEGSRFMIFRVFNAGQENVELVSITNPFRQWKDMNLSMCLGF
eukprot:TRINITY_DN8303_c0_g1_i1.p1 TRINITY_DN8303_c0_g1~~TRINITY_DN8303_c0_g1_i1.p1  ORF type:complete len:2724 (+),score=490.37 TRINITY_DN8303_c0_g1_i1:761-8173(+)